MAWRQKINLGNQIGCLSWKTESKKQREEVFIGGRHLTFQQLASGGHVKIKNCRGIKTMSIRSQ